MVIFVDHADVLSAVDDRAALASLVDETSGSDHGLVITARDRALVDDLIRVPYRHLTLGSDARPGRQPPELNSYEAFEGRRTDMWKLERARDPKITWVSLLGLILVPLLVSGGFLWATWNSDSRLDRVQAAIVNNDEGTTLNDQFVPLGRQLAGGLVNGEDGVANFDWVLTDDEDAQQGIQNGTYAAVVTIPTDFSKRATSFSKDDVSQIEPAEIQVQTSEVSGITDGVVAQVITTAARDTLNTELTEQYLDNIYLGFNATKKQFQSVAKGARKLADGAGGLSDGLDQTSTGAKKLADGLEQLDDGTQQLADGTAKLDTGATQLSDGLEQLATGTKDLPGGAKKLADGAQKSADGADDLADGVKQFTGGLTQLNEGTEKQPGFGEFADGAGDFANGAAQYGTLGAGVGEGVQAFDSGMADASQNMAGLAQLPYSAENLATLKGALDSSSCPVRTAFPTRSATAFSPRRLPASRLAPEPPIPG